MILVMEGNIGAGKTVFCRYLKELLKGQGYHVMYLPEPVKQWQSFGSEAINLLQLLYDSPRRYAFTFQVNCFISMIKNELEAVVHSEKGTVVIMERSSSSVSLFCAALERQKVLRPFEVEILKGIMDMTGQIKKSNHNLRGRKIILYLKTEPEVCFERIIKRNRSEEKDTINLDYIKILHRIHEEEFTQEKHIGKLLRIDGSSFTESDPGIAKLVDRNDLSAKDVLLKEMR